MSTPTISALIIAQNEAEMLPGCLETLHWCDEVVVLDDGSHDETASIAEKWGAKVISFKHESFARLREQALKHAQSEWVIYVDADERILPTLAKEIQVNAETNTATALQFKRSNIFFGEVFEYGGWGQDTVTRVFLKTALEGWSGQVHETPQFSGDTVLLKTPLVHLSHRDVASGLKKSSEWTAIEAELLYKSGVPSVTLWTLLRKGSMEFFRRVVLKKGYKDGSAGVMEGVVQGINRVLVYLQVWERQQDPSIESKYKQIEADIAKLWKEKS